jgi:hypothetical protein
MGAIFFTCVFHMPRMMRKPGGIRLHLPMQLFTGMVAHASRSGDPLLQNPPE